jgi:hypothetical protein
MACVKSRIEDDVVYSLSKEKSQPVCLIWVLLFITKISFTLVICLFGTLEKIIWLICTLQYWINPPAQEVSEMHPAPHTDLWMNSRKNFFSGCLFSSSRFGLGHYRTFFLLYIYHNWVKKKLSYLNFLPSYFCLETCLFSDC